jgi:hypothetical protein
VTGRKIRKSLFQAKVVAYRNILRGLTLTIQGKGSTWMVFLTLTISGHPLLNDGPNYSSGHSVANFARSLLPRISRCFKSLAGQKGLSLPSTSRAVKREDDTLEPTGTGHLEHVT